MDRDTITPTHPVWECRMKSGLLTIAYGPEKYIRMARALSRSYRRHQPKRPFAVVTDERNSAGLSDYFNTVIPLNPEYGSGVSQKLHLDRYTPFFETLFVDSDCLFYGDPEHVWRSYDREDFVVRGWRYFTGRSEYEVSNNFRYLFAKNLEVLLCCAGIERLPHFNGGVYSFRSGDVSHRIFSKAREIYDSRNKLGLTPFKNSPVNDEPVIGIAMELCGVGLHDWDSVNGMETVIGMVDRFRINVLRGQSRFLKNGSPCAPALIHFNVGAQHGRIYHREMLRLELENRSFGDALIKAGDCIFTLKDFFSRVVRYARPRFSQGWCKKE